MSWLRFGVGAMVLAICVAAKAKKRNMKVPTNSPDIATTWARTSLGKYSSLFFLLPRSISRSPAGAPLPFGRRRGFCMITVVVRTRKDEDKSSEKSDVKRGDCRLEQ